MPDGPSADTVRRAITPGSLPQGTRGALEADLQTVFGAGEQAASAPPAGPAPTQADPLGMLLGRETDDLPVTDGMSVGAGAGGPSDVAPTERQRKLMLIAEQAKTPHLRAMARAALRRLARGGEGA